MNTQTNETKLIYASISTPSNKKTKASCYSINCSNSQNCGLYKRGECLLLGLSIQSCPYGRGYKTEGYTKMAKNYESWINTQREKLKDINNNLHCYKDKLTQIGNYMFLPYSYMNMNKEIPFLSHSNFLSFGSYFLPIEHFNIENIIKICEFRPYALMGGTITDYQHKSVPQFLLHLAQSYPTTFQALSNVYPRTKEILPEITNVGRKAYLRTLLPNIGSFTDIHSGIWYWNGEYLTSTNSRMSFGLINDFIEIKMKPHPNTIVKVTDNKQTNENTIYV